MLVLPRATAGHAGAAAAVGALMEFSGGLGFFVCLQVAAGSAGDTLEALRRRSWKSESQDPRMPTWGAG